MAYPPFQALTAPNDHFPNDPAYMAAKPAPLTIGEYYFNTTLNEYRQWDGQSWSTLWTLSPDGSDEAPFVVLKGSTSGNLTLQAAATTTSHVLTMPAAQGGASTVLTNNGSGGLSWAPAAGGAPAWGDITGTLSDQTDLQTALDEKVALAGDTMTGGLELPSLIVQANGPAFTTTITGSAAQSTDTEMILPPDFGTDGYTLTTDGAGALAWSGPDILVALKSGGAHTMDADWQDVASWGSTSGTMSASFNMTTGVFTAPSDGTYVFPITIGFSPNATGARGFRFMLNGSPYIENEFANAVAGGFQTSLSGVQAISLSAGDEVNVQAYQNSGGNLDYLTSGNFAFSCYKLK